MGKIQKIKGFADMFGADAEKFTRMENAARETFSRYGFEELRLPILEKTELFAKSIGEDTDVVGKEMYTFPDRKGRSLTMRPEATAGMCRAFIEGKVHQPGKVSKYFTFGPMFRYERPQKGRMRQFHQLDVETFGAPEPEADAELILMLASFLESLGLAKLSVELNSLGCPECRPAYRQSLIDFYNTFDTDLLCEDCRRRKDTNPLRVLDCKVPSCKELVRNAPTVTDSLCQGCAEHFAAVKAILDASGVAYVVNPRLVRGLDYYQRTTFEVVSGDIGSQSSVAGGGRYDGLVKNLGGGDVCASGFAIGMERIALLLPDPEPARPDFYVAVVDAAATGPALLLAQELRAAGKSGVADFAAGSMKSRMRAADKSGARFCLILGGAEVAEGTVTVKDMAEGGGQKTVSRSKLVDMFEQNRTLPDELFKL
ncbi:MAG: histidine--tRNA ligase [Desulfovibrionaceae bacterium]